MKLNPQQAPLYGECVLTVHLNDEEVCCAEGMEAEVEFYLLFSGSKQQHLTTTLRVSRVTLQAMCPAHDVCEQVLVTLCSARPDGMVVPHSQESFYYVQDLALDMARFLLDNTSLEALFLDDQQVSLKECERLDHSLVLALKHLSLLYKWTSVSLEPWTHIHTDPNITDIVINTQQKTHCNTHIGEEPDKQTVTQTDIATDTNTHTDIDRHNTEQKETHMRTWMDSSTPLENSIDLSQCQQQPTLLHLAASHGLKRVASFLLKQPGGREALRKTNAHGQTPVCLAKSKGHQHLLELFTQYETSLPDQVEPEDQLHIYPGGRVFQHHPSLGTYTLTLSSPQEREGRETEIIVSCCLQEEVKDLSALVQLHQENKGKSDLGGIFKSAPASPPLTSNHDLSSPPCRVWPCSNGQPESKEAADMAVATIENCGKAKQEQESPPSLEGRKQREGSTILSHTSCTTGNFFHRQETGGEQEVTPAANWCVVRSRKSKKRTTKHRTKTLEKNKSTREAVEGTARTQTETTGSTLGTEEETLLLIEPTVAFASSEGESTKNPSSVGTQRTPLPIKPMHRSGCEGKSVGSRAVVLVTTTVEKQEGENWEIDLERSERDVGRNSLTETKQANIKCHPARQRHLKTTLDLASVSNITEHNVTMGQDQSKDPPDSESDQAELCQPDLRDQSPKLESKPRRVLWRDGGWIGAGIASAPHGQEILPNTIWYQDENSDQSLNEGTRKDFHRKQPVSQTVWYDNDTTDQPKNGQHEHKELTSPQASGLSTPQLFEQGLRFHQLSPALSQTHGTGIQPAPSHVAGAQRQEVHRSQQEEEVGEEWKEEGVDRNGKEVENREKSNYREISKRAETEETGEERQETEGRGEKGRRKRRKKRGKKGGMDAKLSSSSSIESQSQTEIQTQRKKVTEQNTQRETERQSDTQAEAKTQTGRADVYSPSVSELVWRKEASNGTMHLPRQTEGTSRNSHGLDHESTTPNSCGNAQEPGQIDLGITEISQFPALQTLETMELSEDESMDIHGPNGDHTNPSCRSTAPEFGPVDLRKMENFELTALQQFGKEKLPDPELVESNFVKPVQPRTSMDHMESSQLLENEDIATAVQTVASVDLTGVVEFNCVKELPLTYSDSTESRKGILEFPEYDTGHIESINPSSPGPPLKHLKFMGKPIECIGSVQPSAAVGFIDPLQVRSLPFECTADASPLKIQEGSTDETTIEYLQDCLASEGKKKGEAMKNEERKCMLSAELVAKNQNIERREEKEKGEEMGVKEKHGKDLSSTHIEREEMMEEDGNRSEDTEKEQNCTEELAATAVALVTVAIASAIASIELSQGLADSQSESKLATQLTSKEEGNNPPSAQDTKVQTETVTQLTEVFDFQRSTQLISKGHANSELPLVSHTVTSELNTKLASETENQLSEEPHIKLHTQFTIKEQASVQLSKETVLLTEIDMQSETHDNLSTDRENQPTTHLNNKEQANLDLPVLTQLHKEGTEPATTRENELCSLHKKEDCLVQGNIKSLPDADEILTQVNIQSHMQTKIPHHQDSQIPCPVVDTGKCPQISDMVHSQLKNLREYSGLQFLSEDQCCLNSHSQENKMHKTADSHPSLSVSATQGIVSGPTHVQDDLDSINTECEVEGKGTCEESFNDTLNSDCQAAKCEGDLHPGSQGERLHVHDVTCCDNGVNSSALPPRGTPYATPCDSLYMVSSNPESEEQTAPVSLENKGTQLSQSLAEKGLVATTHFETCTATFPCEGHHSVSMDDEDGLFQGLAKEMDTQDTVNGWREKEARKNSEEANRDAAIAHDRSQMEPETLPAAAEQLQQTKSDTASTHYLEIQRDRETLCLLQPCPEDNTPVTACTALHPASHPDREECVSVCVLQRETEVSDNVTASAELDDMVFKKLEEPVPRSEGRDREMNVSWSSTDDSSFQGPFSASSLPSQGALSVGMSNAETGWKSRTDEGGGGGMEGGGEEEERQDQLTENPVSSAVFRASICSLSPFRRHSWESGRNNTTGETDMINRSSLNSLSVEVKRTKPPLHRRSMSWCPSNLAHPNQEQIDNRSYSLEGLEVDKKAGQITCPSQGVSDQEERSTARALLHLDSQERGGSLVSLTEEEQEGDTSSIDSQSPHQVLTMTTSCPSMFHHQTLTKSISMVAISQREIDGMSSFSSTAGSAEYSISEDKPGPLRSDTEGRGGTKVSRTFSYLRSKMSKKCKEKDKERRVEKERESKDREKKMANGHVFIPISPSPSTTCQQCTKLLSTKEAFLCNNCGVHVHKHCKESLAVCTKAKMRQSLMPEAVHGSAVNTRNKSTSSASSVSSSSSSSSREHWSMLTSPEDQLALVFPRRNPSILSFNTHSNLAKSISTSNIAGLDDVPLKGLKFLSQSTDSLHQGGKVSASIESLTDEGTELIDSQLMGEFECEVKDLEADSWSATVDKKFLKMLKKDEIKRQDVIYELYQTEFHHVRTLRIMSEVYYKGIQKELQLDSHTLDKVFPMLDVLLATHTQFFTRLLERRRASSAEGQSDKSFLIRSIGDVLVNQFSGCNAEQMKKVYGKFCSRHNEAVNLYKELHTKDKRFQAFIKRIMSNSIVRRLSIPECILLVTQRITKYPVLIQRILQHTKDADEDHGSISDALCYVKELLTAVDSKVNEHEKKRRLREVYSRTDSKSIMRMKSGQMFAKEDLIRGRRLLHDGALQLKNSAGRLKDVHAMLLSDVLVFLQEKDQKYVFASLDQRSTVISLQKLIVREVANEERGLFLITAGIERPEMVEVLASTKDERNTWMAIIQDAMHCMEKDEDEGVPSETEEDRRQHENRVKEIRELLRKKDKQIISLLEEKVHIFRDLSDYNSIPDNTNPPIREHMLFRARTDDVTRGEPIMKDALREVETLHDLINRGLCGAGCSTPVCLTGGTIGPVCLPRRAETFGGFDSHQMNSSKNGEKEEGDESLDLRRTESDSVLKRGATTSLQMLLKRNNEQVLHSVTNLHDLLTSLKAVVVQQDSLIEDQRQALTERLTTNSSSSRHSSSSSLSSSSSSRPSSLIEQEKQRSLERQRQEAASLQKQQVAYQEERRRREKEWEIREKVLAEREERLREEEERAAKKHKELEDERELLVRRKEEYQRDLKRLSEEQRRLERDKEALRRDTERLEAMRRVESGQLQRYQRTPSTTSEDSLRFHSSGSLDFEPREGAEQLKEMEVSSSAPTKEPFLRIGSKKMGKNFNPFSSSSSKNQGAEKECQLPTRLLQLAKPKEKKEKKKKRKGGEQTQTEGQVTVMSDPQNDGDIFFC